MNKAPILIIGARSDIGKAVAHKFASLGMPIQLAARNIISLERDKSDLELRYRVSVSLHEFDALAIESHNDFVIGLPELPQAAICVVGVMGQQEESERVISATSVVLRTNFEGPASIFTILANYFEVRGSGTLVGISSVAGERGRATNYVYGSAKAGFTAFLSGLRNRMAKRGVHVVTVLPGFVRTQMTEDLNLPARLTAEPVEVANAILHAVEHKKNIVYVRKIWWIIMAIIRKIPERLFKQMKI